MATQSFHKAKDPESQKIRRIALVGGFEDFRKYDSHPDNKFVALTNDYLRRSGMDVADDVDIDVINFVNGRRFLQEDKEYDAVYIAFIPQGINMSHTRMEFRIVSANAFDGTDSQSIRDKSRNTIELDNSPKKWVERIRSSKAKVIAVRSGFIEIDLNYLQKDSGYNAYKTLLSPDKAASAMHRGASDFGCESVEKLYGEKIDVPFNWLGVAATPAYLASVAGQIRQAETSLALKARQVLGDAPVSEIKPRKKTI